MPKLVCPNNCSQTKWSFSFVFRCRSFCFCLLFWLFLQICKVKVSVETVIKWTTCHVGRSDLVGWVEVGLCKVHCLSVGYVSMFKGMGYVTFENQDHEDQRRTRDPISSTSSVVDIWKKKKKYCAKEKKWKGETWWAI